MQAEGVINLLIAQDDTEQANHLINLLRNASYTVNSTNIDASKDLASLLKQQSWDLALVEHDAQAVPALDITSQIKKNNLDIPIILIANAADSVPTVEGMRMGADYVVSMDEDQYFLLAVAASLRNLEQRRKLDSWQNQCLEAESRCDKLMDNCKDAIAIVQEGTFVYVNEPYARLFGYQGEDGMIMLPVIDTLAEASQAELMPYLKTLSDDESMEDKSLNIKGVSADTEDLQTTINISQVRYQGELALQFLVANDLLVSDTESIQDTHTNSLALSDVQPKKVMDDINKAISSAQRKDETSLMLFILIDQVDEFRRSSGPLFAEQLTTVVLGNIIEIAPPSTRTVSKFSDDTLVVLLDENNIDIGRELAEDLCRAIASKTYSVGNNSVSLSLSISVSTLDEASESALECVNQCQQAIANEAQNLGQAGSEPQVYCLEVTKSDHKIKSEQQVIEFGRTLLEQRLIGIAFQPIVALQGQVAEYYEVLMRPKVDQYPDNVPKDFITRVFKTKVACDIDRWVILESVKLLADKIHRDPETKLFVNLSAASIQDTEFTSWLKVALNAAKVSPKHLIFQLREIDVGRYVDHPAKLIQQLVQLETQTALTHFGLAINPLLILEKLPVDFVKIDKVMIEAAEAGGEGATALDNILSSLKELPPQVIVPFIETPSMMPTLWQHGVDYIQGYYIHEPAPEMSYDFVETS